MRDRRRDCNLAVNLGHAFAPRNGRATRHFASIPRVSPRRLETMPEIHEGGCLRGAVRYRTVGNPDETEGTGVCHCTFCHRRTGSAFGVNAYFSAPAVEILSGELKTYEYRSDPSHQWLRM